jgi:hypothetical protein
VIGQARTTRLPSTTQSHRYPGGAVVQFCGVVVKMPAPPSVALLSADAGNRWEGSDRTLHRGCATLRVEASE